MPSGSRRQGISGYRRAASTDSDEDEPASSGPRQYTWEERQKLFEERRHLERIAQLMQTTSFSLKRYAGLKLWEDGPNYQKVVKYVNNSQCHPDVSLKVVHIFRVWRQGDPEGLFDIDNRMLLWHGTKRENIPKILDTGFILPTSRYLMFGTGIYFADRITKSSNYSDSEDTFLLLCEVGLGKIYSCKEAHQDWTSPPAGFDSVKGNGKYVPNWHDNGKFIGCLIPYGKTAQCTKYSNHCVNYNEFIVYDPTRIIIRFLVQVEVTRISNPPPLALVTPYSRPNLNRHAASTSAVNSTAGPSSQLVPTNQNTLPRPTTAVSSRIIPGNPSRVTLPRRNVAPVSLTSITPFSNTGTTQSQQVNQTYYSAQSTPNYGSTTTTAIRTQQTVRVTRTHVIASNGNTAITSSQLIAQRRHDYFSQDNNGQDARGSGSSGNSPSSQSSSSSTGAIAGGPIYRPSTYSPSIQSAYNSQRLGYGASRQTSPSSLLCCPCSIM